jgi:hypothetical protein
MTTDLELHQRGLRTALACWQQFARARPRAAVTHLADVSVATFPHGPESAVYNNAVLRRGLRAEAGPALDAMEAAYSACGITRFAAWAHESDQAPLVELDRRGYRLDEWTRAMGLDLDPFGSPFEADDRIADVPSNGISRCSPDSAPRPDSTRASARRPFTPWSARWTVMGWRRRWRSISTATAASTTSAPTKPYVDAGWAAR